MFDNVDSVQQALNSSSYIAERSLATAIYLSLRMRKPLFLEGEAGVGKTEVAKTLARLLNTNLIRLQCYEGLDVSTALYEWNYAHQLLTLGDLPELPVMVYLTRSECLLYAMWGALHLFLARDVDRYLALIRFLAILKLLIGIGLLIVDLAAGVPWFWTVAEGPSLMAYAAVLWWVTERRLNELRK